MHPQMSNDDAHKLFGDKVQVEILSISNDVIGYSKAILQLSVASSVRENY
jgi:hypothetical protein